jgi:hypothetical protein
VNYSSAVLKAMLEDALPVHGVLGQELIATDRILQRWAVSIGMGLPTERWDDRRPSKPPPLDDDAAIVVDQIVLRSPPRTQRLVREWYKTPLPSIRIAQNLGIKSRRALYTSWQLSLNFLKWKFECSNNATIHNLLMFRAYES